MAVDAVGRQRPFRKSLTVPQTSRLKEIPGNWEKMSF